MTGHTVEFIGILVKRITERTRDRLTDAQRRGVGLAAIARRTGGVVAIHGGALAVCKACLRRCGAEGNVDRVWIEGRRT